MSGAPPPTQRFSARAGEGDGGAPGDAQQQQEEPQAAPLPLVPSAAAAAAAVAAPPPPRRQPPPAALAVQQVPDSILRDPLLARAKSVLPSNYNFEVEKTVWRVRQSNAKAVALQLPEGLLMFALALADIVERFGGARHCLVLGDVTYGACCVDDLSARALGCDLLVHYGHSCLVPVAHTAVPCMYVFVDIAVDVQHLVETVRLNFPPAGLSASAGGRALAAAKAAAEAEAETRGADEQRQQGASPVAVAAAAAAASSPGPWPVRRLALAGTIQFSGAVAAAKAALLRGGGGGLGGKEEDDESPAYPPGSIVVPKARPLSPGEVLGCTAPKLPAAAPAAAANDGACCGSSGGCGGPATPATTDPHSSSAKTTRENDAEGAPVDALVFVADGRFHLEAIMIANPSVPAFRYDPYARALTRERYDHRGMRAARRRAVEAARAPGSRWGVVLGTLGRQGNPRLMRLLQQELGRAGREDEGGAAVAAAEAGGGSGGGSRFTFPPGQRPVLAATVLLSEVTPPKLAMIGHVDVWVQVACPRLSIDWGEGFTKPTLTPYEALVALGRAPATWWDDGEEEEEEVEGEVEEEGEKAGKAAAAAVASVSLQPSARREERQQQRRQRQRRRQGGGEEARRPAPLGDYPMDYYAADGGEWSSTYHRRPAAGGGTTRAAAGAAAR